MEGSISASGDVTSLTNGIGGDVALSEACYDSMFYECSALKTAPSLPSTTLAKKCYYDMFYFCEGLTTAPANLPATTVEEECYYQMFAYCQFITTAPNLPATTLKARCYFQMFDSCQSLTNAPEICATEYEYMVGGEKKYAVDCCSSMFNNCVSLYITNDISKATNGGKIIIFTVYDDYYHSCMFYGTCGETFYDNEVEINVNETYYWYIPEE